ncbi:hypothetical protein LIER_02632 [Lithospermum erythrorhizon]|uniref:Uncharacterized protein n=1 Tax=Lithospermum erythrorhizon TaxID=34254 RepID=A0AAV3NU15_LITER
MSESYLNHYENEEENYRNLLIDLEQLLEEEEDEEVNVYENHLEQFLEEEEGGQLDENDLEQFIEEEGGGGRGGHSNQYDRAGEVWKKVKCGRKRVYVDIDRIPEIPLNERMTLDSLSNDLHVSYSILFRRFVSPALKCYQITFE